MPPNEHYALKRIRQELENLQRDPLEIGTVGLIREHDLQHWTVDMQGPVDMPYAQRNFTLSIDFPETYPWHPMHIRFVTPVFHPNVSNEGEVFLGDLEARHWSTALTLRSVLISLQAMLSDPSLEDGCVLNDRAATLLLMDRKAFEEEARRCTAS